MNKLSLANLTVADAGPIELIDAAAAAGFDAVNMWLVRRPRWQRSPLRAARQNRSSGMQR